MRVAKLVRNLGCRPVIGRSEKVAHLPCCRFQFRLAAGDRCAALRSGEPRDEGHDRDSEKKDRRRDLDERQAGLPAAAPPDNPSGGH